MESLPLFPAALARDRIPLPLWPPFASRPSPSPSKDLRAPDRFQVRSLWSWRGRRCLVLILSDGVA
jgi:hypothetical protein